jgi:hypothetical protein
VRRSARNKIVFAIVVAVNVVAIHVLQPAKARTQLHDLAPAVVPRDDLLAVIPPRHAIIDAVRRRAHRRQMPAKLGREHPAPGTEFRPMLGWRNRLARHAFLVIVRRRPMIRGSPRWAAISGAGGRIVARMTWASSLAVEEA